MMDLPINAAPVIRDVNEGKQYSGILPSDDGKCYNRNMEYLGMKTYEDCCTKANAGGEWVYGKTHHGCKK